MNFARETVEGVAGEIAPLIVEHYKEIHPFKDIELKPILEHYLALEEHGLLRIFSVRNNAGELIGYSVFILQKHIHFGGHIYAKENILYIKPDERGVGATFMSWCDDMLEDEGVVDVIEKTATDRFDISPILERQGYTASERVFYKRLKGKA